VRHSKSLSLENQRAKDDLRELMLACMSEQGITQQNIGDACHVHHSMAYNWTSYSGTIEFPVAYLPFLAGNSKTFPLFLLILEYLLKKTNLVLSVDEDQIALDRPIQNTIAEIVQHLGTIKSLLEKKPLPKGAVLSELRKFDKVTVRFKKEVGGTAV